MRQVLVDQCHCIITRRSVSRINASRGTVAKHTQRVQIVGHVAVRGEDRRRTAAEDGVAGEEIAVRGQKADVLVRVSGCGDDLQPFHELATGYDLVGGVKDKPGRDDTCARS